jgi:hypothetical protein
MLDSAIESHWLQKTFNQKQKRSAILKDLRAGALLQLEEHSEYFKASISPVSLQIDDSGEVREFEFRRLKSAQLLRVIDEIGDTGSGDKDEKWVQVSNMAKAVLSERYIRESLLGMIGGGGEGGGEEWRIAVLEGVRDDKGADPIKRKVAGDMVIELVEDDFK